MLGVQQGVPYLFCDFVRSLRGSTAAIDQRSVRYRVFLSLAVVKIAEIVGG